MTARFCTGRRIISSVMHRCAEAAAKGFSFGTVIGRGTRMSRCWKPECIVFGLILFAGGCTLGPDFKTPPATVADKWLEQGNKSVDFAASEHRDWWAAFNDPRLTRLIQLAYQQNLTSGFPSDLHTQIGLVLMIALAAKNAILIVEFARELKAEGMSTTDAAVEATRRRFRPILTTSIAFILGIVPLMTATGAGAASQQSLGTVVFGGMLASTLLAIPFVSVFYIVMEGFSEWRRARKGITSAPSKVAVPKPAD